MKKILYRIKLSILKRKVYYELLVFIMLFSMLFASLYIDAIAKKVDSNIFSDYGLYVAMQSNYSGLYDAQSIDKYGENVDEFYKTTQILSGSEYVSYSDFSFSTNYSVPLFPIEYSSSNVNMLYKSRSLVDEERHKNLNELNYGMEAPIIKSTTNVEPSDFHFEYAILTEGRLFSNEDFENNNNVCIIPYESVLYDGNEIQEINIGDTITISELVQSGNEFINKEYLYEVIGKYKTKDGLGIEYAGKHSHPIYIPHNRFKEMVQSLYDNISKFNPNYLIDDLTYSKLLYMHPAYYKFNNIQSLDLWMESLKNYEDKFPYEYQYYTSIDENYSVFANLISISSSFEYIAMMCLLICVIGAVVMVTYEIHNRGKEIGILLAIGESKSKIMIQLILEKMIVLFSSATISICMILLLKEPIMKYLIGIKSFENLESLKNILYLPIDIHTFLTFILYTCLIAFTTIIVLYFGLRNKEVNEVLKGDSNE